MVRKKGKDRDRERLKIDMQFQVHTADDDKLLRCGKRYGGEDAPGSSIPANRKITFKDKKIVRDIFIANLSGGNLHRWHG